MVLRVLNQILEVPKLGRTPRAHLGPIWSDLAKIWPNKIDLVTLRDSYNCVGGYIWGLFSKNIEF